MKNRTKFKSILVSGVLALMMAFAPLAGASDKNNATDVITEVEVAQQDQATEKRQEIFEEATAAAINETKKALCALDEKNIEEALAALERASGKLTKILTQNKPHTFNNIQDFSSFIHNQFNQDNNQLWNNFDNYFDKDFFQKQPEPFVAMEKFHQGLEEMMEDNFKNPFNHSWDSWIADRFSGLKDTVNITSQGTKDSYIFTLTVPNLKENQLSVNIDENGISLQGEISKLVEKKDSKGNIVVRNEMKQLIAQKFSIPADADYKTAEIKNQNDKIIITVQKKKPT